ncbi:equistatin-like [Dreissena polymorpha]|uniref:Thyroglobulin type-1 domain-containing protein n=1 Tax=Dreissena polymorpha TaxID=45954 RepID=A0A9D3YEW0_DREPO|nr:equistatin-like [Dreissena polymorpha]KAH3699284.1 hypothetical protein DPMN_074239 [Dreissena polymorpha]
MIKLLVISMLAAAGARAMILCPQNACHTVRCASVQNCEGRVNQGGGWCGCCDICMTQLAEGDNCLSTLLLGVPATTECGAGLQCDRDTQTCVKEEAADTVTDAPCAVRKEEIRRAQANGLPLIGVSSPSCDVNGYYSAVQCIGSVCTCSDRQGNQLQDFQDTIGNLANMNCQCAVDLDNYMKSGLIGKMFYCAPNGNYQTTQPPAVQATTAAPTGNLVGNIGGFLYSSGACAHELATAQTSNLLGVFVPECDADGKYAPRQCKGSGCYCVRKDGTKIEGYSAPISEKVHMTCQCARDKDTYEAMGILGRIHTCRANGNYQSYQCIGSSCYCTDDAGYRLGDQSVSIGDINDLKC